MAKVNAENNKFQKEHFAKLGERIRELRLNDGISIKGMEELLELPSGTIHNIEHGKGGSGVSMLAIITYFSEQGYSFKWMLDFDNENHFKNDEQHIYLDLDKAKLIEISKEFSALSKVLEKTVNKYK